MRLCLFVVLRQIEIKIIINGLPNDMYTILNTQLWLIKTHREWKEKKPFPMKSNSLNMVLWKQDWIFVWDAIHCFDENHLGKWFEPHLPVYKYTGLRHPLLFRFSYFTFFLFQHFHNLQLRWKKKLGAQWRQGGKHSGLNEEETIIVGANVENRWNGSSFAI